MKKNRVIIAIISLMICAAVAFAATNYVHDGTVVNLFWANVSPSSGAAVVKGTSKANGAIVGVALNGRGVAGETGLSIATRGVFDLPVTASSTVGNIAIGDYIYTSMGGAGTCTADLSNINTGILFGQALEAITATTTAGVYSTIKVLLRQPGHL